MKIIQSLEEIEKPFNNAVVTIGNFDGVHIGHQALFHSTIEKAQDLGGTSVALTFEPHPLRVLKPNGHPPLITLYEQKCELIEHTGIDVLVCIPFTLDFAQISARNFVADLLIDKLGTKAIVVGKDYTFGKNREGNVDLLNRFATEMNFELVVLDWIQSLNGTTGRISSTRIRELVQQGRVGDARKLLGRWYQIRGTVAQGRKRGGKLLGFPTANINLYDELCPKMGVYAVTVEHGGNQYAGVANIGYSPTFDDHVFTVEVHIFDFSQEIYAQPIRVNFIERLRDEKKFDSVQHLARQIEKDATQARQLLQKLTDVIASSD